MNILKKILIVLIPTIVLFGCNKEDYTGFSTETPTNPTITVDLSKVPTSAVSDLLKTSYKVTLNMDVAQIVDVKVYVNLSETSSATADEDFTYESEVVIPAGRKTASFNVSILDDELPEANEEFTLIIGDERTANASITPVNAKFSISNGTLTQYGVSFSWYAEAYDIEGVAITPANIADMVLTVYDMDFNTIYQADGSGFEAVVLENTIPDGDYYVAVSFYDVLELGEQGGLDLDLFVDYKQLGVQSGGFEFPAALNTESNFANTAYLAIITKAGSTWTMNEFEGFVASDLNFASASWGGLDGWMPDYMFANQVEIAGTTGAYTIIGLSFDWIPEVWGEVITDSVPVNITFKNDGTIEILDQYYLTTDFDGGSIYNIYGTGTWNRQLTPIALTLNYELVQDGSPLSEWGYANGYTDYEYFICDLVQGGAKQAVSPKVKGKIRR